MGFPSIWSSICLLKELEDRNNSKREYKK